MKKNGTVAPDQKKLSECIFLICARKHNICYILKMGLQGYTLFFLFLLKNVDCGYSLKPPLPGGSNKYPQCIRNMKNIRIFIWKGSFFGCEIFDIFELACLVMEIRKNIGSFPLKNALFGAIAIQARSISKPQRPGLDITPAQTQPRIGCLQVFYTVQWFLNGKNYVQTILMTYGPRNVLSNVSLDALWITKKTALSSQCGLKFRDHDKNSFKLRYKPILAKFGQKDGRTHFVHCIYVYTYTSITDVSFPSQIAHCVYGCLQCICVT